MLDSGMHDFFAETSRDTRHAEGIINFQCRACQREFDCEVGEIAINDDLRPDFEKPILCPQCGERTIDQVWLTELAQSQMTPATRDL